MAGAGPAGQEQAGPRGWSLGAMQVSHQPAAEEGRGALELHPLHLKVHTWRGRQKHSPRMKKHVAPDSRDHTEQRAPRLGEGAAWRVGRERLSMADLHLAWGQQLSVSTGRPEATGNTEETPANSQMPGKPPSTCPTQGGLCLWVKERERLQWKHTRMRPLWFSDPH